MKTEKQVWDQMVDATVSQMNSESPENAGHVFGLAFAECNEKLVIAGMDDEEREYLMMDFALRVHEQFRGNIQ